MQFSPGGALHVGHVTVRARSRILGRFTALAAFSAEVVVWVRRIVA